jgi:TPR repeat protein
MSRALLIALILFALPALAASRDDLAAGSEAYRKGEFAEAARLFRLAADAGDPTAQDSLGVMYVNGEGVPQDYVEAYTWFNIADAIVSASDDGWHARLDRFRNTISGEMTPDQIAEAGRRAREWKRQ